MTREQKAEIARRNGAKSRGPLTPAGKLHCSRNALKHGKKAAKLKYFIPPEDACANPESRQAFFHLLDAHLEHYRPFNEVSYNVVREIAVATWQMQRLTATRTRLLNRHFETHTPGDQACAELASAHRALPGDTRTTAQLATEINRLQRRIRHLERRLVFNRQCFLDEPEAEFPIPLKRAA
jgi:hypothetical protein